ncbi:hypothetical protein BT96DRAFT_987170 [Gymnopus androsaceus JB14]|uniref:Uncharacterized protein n=1 Tax=Gymnopus androsaceus JB14 TaxID=1447944 RepID=A0A6A4IA67_9AGAR|nr:hypothetical protein BT96DRAFT_987170 [Gymnopus androsaceus JB14]
MSRRPRHDRDSVIRASILDVFVTLGAFDRNNPITQWMFEDDENMTSEGDDKTIGGSLGQVEEEEPEEERDGDRGRSLVSSRSEPEMKDESSTTTTTFKQRFGMFRSKSKSRKREREREQRIDTMTSDSGDSGRLGLTSSSSARSKSKTRRLFSSKSKIVDSTAASDSTSARSFSQSDVSEPTNPSQTEVTAKKSIRRVFGRKRRNGDVSVEEEVGVGSESHADQIQDWEHVAPLTPAALMAASSSWGQSRQADEAGAGAVQEGTLPLPRTFSFAVPRTALDRHISSAKRRITRQRPPTLHIADEGGLEVAAIGISTSLPPSPFILVAPENDDYIDNPTTPYVFCTPTIDQTETANRPVYPVSVSKTIRRSMIMDNLDIGESGQNGHVGLRRSISLQDTSRTSFLREADTDIGAYSPTPDGGRGRQVPFPTRPVLPLPLSISLLGDARHVRLSLDARASVIRQRYRRVNRNSISEGVNPI